MSATRRSARVCLPQPATDRRIRHLPAARRNLSSGLARQRTRSITIAHNKTRNLFYLKEPSSFVPALEHLRFIRHSYEERPKTCGRLIRLADMRVHALTMFSRNSQRGPSLEVLLHRSDCRTENDSKH